MADEPELLRDARRHQQQVPLRQQAEAAASPLPLPPNSAWRSQPAKPMSSGAASRAPPSRPAAEPQVSRSSSTLRSWPSPAESATTSSSNGSSGGSSSGRPSLTNGHLRLTSPSAPSSPMSLSASSSPSPLSQLPASPPRRLPSIAAAESATDRLQPLLPAVRVVVTDGGRSLLQSRHPRASAGDERRWATYSALETDELYYLMMVRETRERLQAEKEEKRTEEQQQREAAGLREEEERMLSSSFPSLSISRQAENADSSAASAAQVDADSLRELLLTMFPDLDDGVISSVVSSLSCLSVDLQQLNACVDTLSAITADDLPHDEAETGAPCGPVSPSSAAAGDEALTDQEIAARMAADPRYSPPRAVGARSSSSSLRSALPSSSASSSSSSSKKVRVDLSKQALYQWAPPTAADSVLSPSLSARWSLDALYRAFPRVDRELVDGVFAGTDCSWSRARDELTAIFPGELLRPAESPSVTHMQHKERSTRRGEQQPTQADGQPEQQRADCLGEGMIDDEVMEREVGAVLDNRAGDSSRAASSSFSSSSTHAHRRAAFFRAATEAFLHGSGALARAHAARGREEGELMLRCQVTEALAVFREQNRNGDCSRAIDLHGLHVRPAVCLLDFAVRRARRKGQADLIAITGRGRNSQGGRSRLRPAVEDFCTRHRLRHSAVNEAEIKISWR